MRGSSRGRAASAGMIVTEASAEMADAARVMEASATAVSALSGGAAKGTHGELGFVVMRESSHGKAVSAGMIATGASAGTTVAARVMEASAAAGLAGTMATAAVTGALAGTTDAVSAMTVSGGPDGAGRKTRGTVGSGATRGSSGREGSAGTSVTLASGGTTAATRMTAVFAGVTKAAAVTNG